MSLEDEPSAGSPGPGPSEPPFGDEPPDDVLPLPGDLPAAAPPRNVTSRADKRRNQRRR